METSNRDDYLSYDISRLDLNKQDFSFSVGVLSSGLGRGYASIERESGSPDLGNERRAYLWSLPDGTSLYLRAVENLESSDDRHDYGYEYESTHEYEERYRLENPNVGTVSQRTSLVLTDSTGSPKSVLGIPASVAGLPLQNATVETRFTTEKGKRYAKISVRFEKSSNGGKPDLEAAGAEVSMKDPVVVYVGSTKPKIENGVEKFDYNWGGKRDCPNPSIEIIDSFMLSSFD